MPRWVRKPCTALAASAVIGLWSLLANCSAGSSPNTFGSANSSPSSSTATTSRDFQRGYSSITGALQGALGHQLRDLALLHLDAHAVGHFQRHEQVPDVGHLAEHSAARDHLVAGGQLRHQRLVLLGAPLLRADEHEIEECNEGGHQQRKLQLSARGGGGGLRPSVGDQAIHSCGPEAKRAALCHEARGSLRKATAASQPCVTLWRRHVM